MKRIVTFLSCVPLGVAINDHVATVTVVDGASMSPVLNPRDVSSTNDVVLVNRIPFAYNFSYRNGDVVLCRSPEDPHAFVVKRLMGQEGEMVTYRNRSVFVSRGRCWLQGDNLRESHDSRSYGTVPMSLLEGKVSFVLWPPNRVGFVK